MSKLPSMPLFVDAYLGDTTHLKTEEHGAYLLLLMGMWARGGSLADNDEDNASICRLSLLAWRKMKPRILPFLAVYGPEDARMLTQGRLQKEWNYAQERRAKQSEKGTKSGEARRSKRGIMDQIVANRGSTAVQPQFNRDAGVDPDARLNPKRTPNPISNTLTSFTTAEAGQDLASRLETPLMQRVRS